MRLGVSSCGLKTNHSFLEPEMLSCAKETLSFFEIVVDNCKFRFWITSPPIPQ